MPRAIYNQEFTIENSYLTEIDFNTAPTAGDKIFFKDYPNLTPRNGQKIVFTGVEAYFDGTLLNSPNGLAVLGLGDCAKLTFTIAVGSTEKIYKMPVTNLITFINGGFIRKLNNLQVTITKSYVTVNAPGILANRSICFNWYYVTRPL
jgi:hypothetical protein